jgi:hypothetical protein
MPVDKTKSKYDKLKKQFEELPYNADPQEIYDVLNEEFGMCGFGWKYRLLEHFERKISSKSMMFVKIELYLRCNGQWSDPIPSVGGVLLNDKADIISHAVDEAIYKALKMLCLPDSMDKKTILKNIANNAKKVNFTTTEIKKIIREKYGVNSSNDLSIEQAIELNNHFYDILLESMKIEHDFIMSGKA